MKDRIKEIEGFGHVTQDVGVIQAIRDYVSLRFGRIEDWEPDDSSETVRESDGGST